MSPSAYLAIGIAALASGPVLADENSGLYLGAGFGDFSSDFDDVGDVDIELEDSDASQFFGGWRFNRFMAVQLDYIDFGEAGADVGALNIEADTEGLLPSFVATLPLPLGPLEVFGRVGVLFYDIDVSFAGGSLVDESGEEFVYGVGIGVALLERLALRAQYDVIEIDEVDDAEAVWLTAAWRF